MNLNGGNVRSIFLTLGIVVLAGCGEKKEKDPLRSGWNAYAGGDYFGALAELQTAKQKEPNDPDIRNALGWTYMKLDSLESANHEFQEGASLTDPPTDLRAGWSFVLSALQDHGASNAQASLVLSVDPDWVFVHFPLIDHIDLRLVKAENHFLLGEFAAGLAEIQAINAAFIADIDTAAGRALLAKEIERLRGINKSIEFGL